jgi:hypothetical protein
VLRTVGVMHQIQKAFKAFDDPDWDLAWFVEPRIFPRCNKFLVPWPRDIESWLA